MPGSTPELALATAVDSDDNADYLTLSLANSLRTVDGLFSNTTGHTHGGLHQGGPISSIPAGAIPDGSVTSAKIADGTITALDMAAGAAATNVGTLGGELAGTLPNPTLKHLTNTVGAAGLGSTVISSAATWTLWGQATSIVLAIGTYLVVASGTYQTTASSGGKAALTLGFGSNVAGTLLTTDLNYINIDNQTWRVRLVALAGVTIASYSPWLQVFAGAVGTISDGKCEIVKLG